MAKTLDVNMLATFSGAATFTGAATFNSAVDVNSTLQVAGVATFSGAANFDGGVDMDSDLNIAGTLTVTGSVDFKGALNVDGLVDIDSDLNVAGTLTVTGDITGVVSGVRETGTGGAQIKVKVIEIGDWNMDSTDGVSITHGIADFTKIRDVGVMIRDDAGTTLSLLFRAFSESSAVIMGTVKSITSTVITIVRTTSGGYDSSSYDSTSYNRGWVTIWYQA